MDSRISAFLLAQISPSLYPAHMFGFFKKRREEKAARDAEAMALGELLREVDEGRAGKLDLALVIHDREGSKESLSRVFMELPQAELYVANASAERLEDPAVMLMGEPPQPFAVVFTRQEWAVAGAHPPFDRVEAVSAMELALKMPASAGMVFNPETPLVTGVLTAPMLDAFRQILEHDQLMEGTLYTVWTSGAYRVVKLLKVDAGGVHIRLYAGGHAQRPQQVEPAMLTLSGADEKHRSMGHLPFTRRSFLAMGPRLLTVQPVQEEELEGYRLWAEAQGGYFGG